ncbi:MAG TPA: F0F1 ATP synthase subunit B [Patescibacteria group bacterium]|nr:F0F1 ATP synthase subunit B [Patescibacteria group bacterium]
MESIIATFHIDWKLIIAQLINFLIVIFVLWFFALKPLTKVMRERTQTIEKGLAQAKEAQEKLEIAQKEQAVIIKDGKKQAQAIIEQAKSLADNQREKIIAEAKGKVAKIIDESKQQLNQEKKEVISEINKDLAEVVVLACQKILESVVDKKIDQALVKKTLNEIQKNQE